MAWMLFFAAGASALWLSPTLVFADGSPDKGWLLPVAGCLLGLGLLAGRYRKRSLLRAQTTAAGPSGCRFINFFCRSIGCSAAFLAGFTYAHWHAAQAMAHTLPEAYDGEEFVVEGVVHGLVVREPLHRYDGSESLLQRFEFQLTSIAPLERSLHGTDKTWPRRLRLASYGALRFNTGERWRLVVRLRSPRGLANPGSFDQRRFMLARKLDAQGYVRDKYRAELVPARKAALVTMLQQARADRYHLLQPVFTQTRNPNFYNALLLGEKAGLAGPARQLLQGTGTAHLMAISGLHIGLAAGMGVVLGRLLFTAWPGLALYLPAPALLAICSIPPAAFYAVLAGLAVPTQRALLMVCSMAVSMLWQRSVRRFNHWLVALASVCLFDPLSVLASGFWLSFAAVALLLLCVSAGPQRAGLPTAKMHVKRSPRLRRWRWPAAAIWQKTRVALRAQAAIFIGMPVLLLMFGLPLPLVAPLANFIVVPLVAIWVVPAGLCAVLASYISLDAAAVLVKFADIGLQFALQLLALLDNLSDAQLSASAMQPLVLASATFAVLGVLRAGARAPFFPLAILAWLLLFSPLAARLQMLVPQRETSLQSSDFIITQFDVGQGSAVLVSTRNQQWLYDTGGEFGQRSDAARAVLLPAMRRLGINALDGVIISHGDKDHAGGAASLAAGLPVGAWYFGGKAGSLAEQLERNMTPCVAGRHWQVDGVRFEFLHPAADAGDNRSENERSCVLKISPVNVSGNVANGSVLLAGDIGTASERHLLSALGDKLAAEVLLVPHHGSKSSSSKAFVNHLSPRYALVSAGFNNRYGHPNAKVESRYQLAGSEILRSDRLGAIQLAYVSGAWQMPRCTRFKGRFFWQLWDNSVQCAGRLRKL